MGMLNLAFLPLDQVSPRANELYEKAVCMVRDLETSGAPHGLLAQYRIQLERLRPGSEKAGPGHEMLCIQCLSGGRECVWLLWWTGVDGTVQRSRSPGRSTSAWPSCSTIRGRAEALYVAHS